jgi:hypothetical protein
LSRRKSSCRLSRQNRIRRAPSICGGRSSSHRRALASDGLCQKL